MTKHADMVLTRVGQTFPAGTTVGLYRVLMANSGVQQPGGEPVATAVVAENESLVFEDVAQDQPVFYAAAKLGDEWRSIQATTPVGEPLTNVAPVAEAVEELEANKADLGTDGTVGGPDGSPLSASVVSSSAAPEDEETPTWNKDATAYKPRKLTYRNLHDAIYGANTKGESSIKAAFEAAVVDAVGRTLYIPAGTHLGAGLQLPSAGPMKLIGDGEGSVLKLDPASAENFLLLMQSNTHVEGIHFDGNREGTPTGNGRLIHVNTHEYVEVGHITAHNVKGETVFFNNCSNVYVHDIAITDPGVVGVLGQIEAAATKDSANIELARITVGENLYEPAGEPKGIKLLRGASAHVYNHASVYKCRVERAKGGGMCFELECLTNGEVDQNYAQGAGEEGTFGISLPKCIGGHANDNTIKKAHGIGLELSGAEGTIGARNRVIETFGGSGIQVNDNGGSKQSNQVILAENIVIGTVGTAGNAGIKIYRAESISVVVNHVTHTDTATPAIEVQSTSAGNPTVIEISGNNVNGAGTAKRGITFEGAGTLATYVHGGNLVHDFAEYGVVWRTGKYIGSTANTFKGNVTGNEFFFESVVHAELLPVSLDGFATVASASTTTLPENASVIEVTGTTEMKKINASRAGRKVTLVFASTPTVKDGENLKLSADLVATADDSLSLVCNGTNWYETGRSVN